MQIRTPPTPPERPRTAPGARPLAARMRPRRARRRSSARSTCSARARPLRVAIEQGQPHSMILYGPPGSGKTTLARIVAARRARGVRGAQRRRGGRGPRCARCSTAPQQRRQATGERDDLLPRRDPPLQQGPAGRAAAGRRGGPRHADRGDDGEPVLRGQLGAAVAHAGLRAEGADRRGRRGAAAPRAERGDAAADGRRRRARVPRRRAPAATRARRWPRSSWPCRRRDGRVDARSTPRTRCSAGRSATTRSGDHHYDTISAWIKATRGSDPDASPLLPRGDARGAARTRASSCGAW